MSDTPPYEPRLGLKAAEPVLLQRTWLQRMRVPLMVGFPLLLALAAGYYFLTAGRYQSTDNAYVKLARVGVSFSVGGRVISVDVKENQAVRKGEVLVRLDDGDYQIAIKRAEAAYAAAKFRAAALLATYQQRLADKASAEETAAYTAREAARQKNLAAEGVNSKGQADEALHAAAQAKAELAAAEQRVLAALADIGGDPTLPVEQFPDVLKAAAELEQARNDATYTALVAPEDGVATKVDQVQVGLRVAPSQTLFWLVSGRPWIEANFKEDQLKRMAVGQPVKVHVDALDRDLTGRVISFSPGTGSSFSLLPPENATGNWVKVTQRLAVQIAIDGDLPPLASGLSATVEVDTAAEAPAAP